MNSFDSVRTDLLHISFGANRGGCETNAATAISSLPHLRHRVLVLGSVGPMMRVWKDANACIDICDIDASRSQVFRVVRDACNRLKPSGIIMWHGARLRQVIGAAAAIPLAIHIGNPVSVVPFWRSAWERLHAMYYPGGQRNVRIICCSQWVTRSVPNDRFLLRFPCLAVPNGVSVTTHKDLATIAGGNAKPEFRIGMAARLDTIKDHATLLKAFAIVHAVRPAAVLELAGDGPERESLATLAQLLNISSAVRFLGVIGDVHALIANWDLFVFATTDREGLGNALVEAMLIGVPCVATDVGPIREFTLDGRQLKLVPGQDPLSLANAMIELIDDARQRELYAVEGQRFAEEKFCADEFARRYAESLGL